MSRPRSERVPLALAALLSAALLLVSGCPGNDDGSDKDSSINNEDSYLCKYPPNLSECDPPPNSHSQEYYHCWGCNCTGSASIAACNQSTGDCRFFAFGCYPETYTSCNPQAPSAILAMCEYCFLKDAGGGVEKCDKLSGSTHDLGVEPEDAQAHEPADGSAD